jgi:hypothetical protein
MVGYIVARIPELRQKNKDISLFFPDSGPHIAIFGQEPREDLKYDFAREPGIPIFATRQKAIRRM